jgi:outer membrane protein assembly factor BamB
VASVVLKAGMRAHLFSAWMLLLLPSVAAAWRADLRGPGDEVPTAVAVAPGGDVLMATQRDDRLDLIRLRGRDGQVIWQQQVGQSGGWVSKVTSVGDDVVVEGFRTFDGAYFVQRRSGRDGTVVWGDEATEDVSIGSVAVDARGDVIVSRAGFGHVQLRKLEGATGRELWQYAAARDSSNAEPAALAIDSRGDVFVGWATVEKLDGSTGGRLWSADLTPAFTIPEVSALELDPSGNVVVEALAEGSDPRGFLADVLGIDGRDGSLLWLQDVGYPGLLSVDPSGRPIVGEGAPFYVGLGVHARSPLTLSRLDPTTGAHERTWRLGSLVQPTLVSVDELARDGDLLASVAIGAQPSTVRLIRLRSRGGAVAWTRSLGRLHGPGAFHLPRVALGPDDTVVAAWVRHRRATGYDPQVVTLSATTGRETSGPRQ